MSGRANFESWEQIVKVGSGGFGEVWKVRTEDGSVLAAKYIDLSSTNISWKNIHKEISILQSLNHENVVHFETATLQGSKLVVFTEFIEGSDLSKLGSLDEPRAVGFLRQICEGLYYLHTRKPPVLHRDIKGENIMVTRDGTVKIIDFGLSINLLVSSGVQTTDVIMTCTNLCGTLPFIAPEVFKKFHFSVKSDVWALGITIYQMMTGTVPQFGANVSTVMEEVKRNGAPPLPAGCSQQLIDFYSRCTAQKPKNRLSVRKLLKLNIFEA